MFMRPLCSRNVIVIVSRDVDVTIRTSQVHADNYRTKCLFELSRMLRDSSFSDKPFVVANAKVPILTFETRPPLGKCSVSNLQIRSLRHHCPRRVEV